MSTVTNTQMSSWALTAPEAPCRPRVWIAEGDQAGAEFGASVATAGDVNGDGFSDVVIGAPYLDNGPQDEGWAFVYHGSPLGLGNFAPWTLESNQANANLGVSVAGVGDTNGDGFSDLLIGAPRYDAGQQGEGRCYHFFGNQGDGLDRIPRQARSDDSALILPLGMSDSPTQFLVKGNGRTALGRGSVRIAVEVKPASMPFDGTEIVIGPAIDTGFPGGSGSVAPVSHLVSGLTPGTLYHWRMRLASDSPFFPYSNWLSLPNDAVTEGDVRTPEGGVGVDESASAPALRWLGAPVPNPFTTATAIEYALPAAGQVRLAVYDVQGRQAALLADETRAAGRYTVRWDGRDGGEGKLSAGVYFVRFEFGGEVESRKITLAP
jgi:hypothetical protein